VKKLTSIGIAAVTTAATGSTTPIRPLVSPMYKATSPIAPETPAIPPRIRFPEDGIPSPEVSAKAIRNPALISCEITTTLYTLPRLVARPPLKSPDPQHAAEVKPNAIANTSEPIMSADALIGKWSFVVTI
jgi:hypothetical protein